MALFAYLGNLEFHIIPQFEMRTQRQMAHIHPLNGNIFGKITRLDVKSKLFHLIYTGNSQQADLPVGLRISMPISLYAVICHQVNVLNRVFFGTLFLRCAYRFDFCQIILRPAE